MRKIYFGSITARKRNFNSLGQYVDTVTTAVPLLFVAYGDLEAEIVCGREALDHFPCQEGWMNAKWKYQLAPNLFNVDDVVYSLALTESKKAMDSEQKQGV